MGGESKAENEPLTQNVADGVILGQLMAAQNLLFVLPDKKNIASYFAPLLLSVPGVRSCRVCLGASYSMEGGFQDEACSHCPNRRGDLDEFSTLSKQVECQYVNKPFVFTTALETSEYRFGNFIIEFDQPELFDLYKPFIHNLGNFLAVTLENRLNKHRLETANKSLEIKVEERTRQLRVINRELKAISHCNQVLVRADEEQALLNDICRIICDMAGYRLAWVGYAENDETKTLRPVASYGYDEGYTELANISWDEQSERGNSMAGRAIRSGRSIYSQDLEKEPLFSPWSAEASKRGFRSGIALPMKDAEGLVFGALMIYSTEKEAITDEEVRMLEELAGDLAFGITSLRIREEKKLALEALQKSEASFHTLFDRVNDGVYRSTHEGRFVDINPAMVEMFGYSSKEEMMAVDIRQELYFAPDDRDRLEENRYQDKTDVFRMRRKDGSEIWVEDNGHYEKDAQGNTQFHEGILRDITKRKKMEDDLIRAKDNAELSDKLKTEFLQNISHEIRTPMNAICGFSKILSSPDLSPTEWNEFSGIVQSNIDQLLSIINDIITISSIKTNQESLDIELISLNDVLNELYHAFHADFEKKGCILNVEKQWEDSQAFIYTDGSKLYRVLSNLISNALKFTAHGAVGYGYVWKDDSLEFFVRDSGIGIEPEKLQEIFEPFQQASSNVGFKHSGTGLGLSISKGFVELLGGKIRAQSELGKGTTIYFTIPYESAY